MPPFLNTPDVSSSEIEKCDFADYCKAVEQARLERPSTGCRSLRDAAIENIITNMHLMSFELLEALADKAHLLKSIWQRIQKRSVTMVTNDLPHLCTHVENFSTACTQLTISRQFITFDSFKIFSKLLFEESDSDSQLFLYEQVIRKPTLSLSTYIVPMTSVAIDFITCLSIASRFSISELVKLASVRNLGTLELVEQSGQDFANRITDRLVRVWSESSSKRGAFPVLRVLRFVSCRSLTADVLTYLNSFPSLGMVVFAGHDFDVSTATTKASKEGWDPLSRVSASRDVPVPCHQQEHLRSDVVADPLSKSANFARSKNSAHYLPARFFMYLDFLEVGRRRSNKDIVASGLPSENQSFFGSDFCGIPTVVMQLGPKEAVSSNACTAFTRFDFGSSRRNVIFRYAPKRSIVPQSRHQLRKGKKQKLESMMKSFN